MKDTHFLYIIAVLAVVGITTVFIAYATDTLLMHTPKVISSSPPKLTTQKKNCGCCAEKIDAYIQKMKQQILEIEGGEAKWVEATLTEIVDNYNR